MEEKLSGIVLGGVNFGESDKILNIFTLEKGTISAKIKGVKKAGAKLKFASEPFCFAEFIFMNSNGRRTVIGASLIDSFFPIRQNIVTYFCGGACLEFVKRFYKEGIISSDTFVLLVDTLKNMAYGDKNPKWYLVNFFLSALKLSGYLLNADLCANCGCNIEGKTFFDYVTGSFYCSDCALASAREINNSTLKALIAVKNGLTLEEGDLTGALRLIEYYLINKTEEKNNSLTELLKMNS